MMAFVDLYRLPLIMAALGEENRLLNFIFSQKLKNF